MAISAQTMKANLRFTLMQLEIDRRSLDELTVEQPVPSSMPIEDDDAIPHLPRG